MLDCWKYVLYLHGLLRLFAESGSVKSRNFGRQLKRLCSDFSLFFTSCDGQIFELWKGRVILPPRDDTRDVPRLYSTENFKLDFRLKPDFLYNERSSNGLEYWSIWRNTKIAGKTMLRPSSFKKLEKGTSMDTSF